MIQKNIKSRIVNKHAIESDWLKATNFVPLQGELIIYDIEIDADGNTLALPEGRTIPYTYERFKIGDGVTNVNELPFANDGLATEDYVDEKMSSVSGGGIIDVIELPTENINEDAFYRLLAPIFVYNQFEHNNFTCYCVETLPEVGEPATTDMTTITAYYNVSDGICYAYVDSALSSAMSVPVGWYDASVLLPAAGYAYGGVITSLDEATLEDTFYLMLQYVIYSYKDNWTALKFIGKNGTGASAEIFNHPSNEASGVCSHAEGHGTTASGNYSHAEGAGTTASKGYSHAEGYSTEANGTSSHAEGDNTTASGNHSHAEGHSTTASGDHSHAEGLETKAIGEYSHAEGAWTQASSNGSHAEGHSTVAGGNYSHAEGSSTFTAGRSQHAQGEYNIIDLGAVNSDTIDPDSRGKYAHIVGNGTSDTERSNAHTLDWSGNAWFQGNVYVGGTGQDDTTAKKMATEEYVNEKVISPIIYTTEKPSTPEQAIYVITEDEVVKVEFYQSQILTSEQAYCEIVDALPESANPAMDLTTESVYAYYLTTTEEISVYVDESVSTATNGEVPVGWYSWDVFCNFMGATYGGQITSTDQATDDTNMYALLTKQPKTRVYVPMQDGAFLELTSGIRTRFDENSGTVSITEM